MSIITSDWFIYNVREFLNPKDVYMLKYVNKELYKNIPNIDQDICRNIHKRLKLIFKNNYDKFINFMNNNNVAISGSFIIQCCSDEYYENSDVDVYIYGQIYKKHGHYSNLSNIANVVDNYAISIDEIVNGDPFDISSLKNDFDTNKYDNHDTTKIQKIYLQNTGTYHDFIAYTNKSFDLSFCKNIFTIVNGKNILYINNLNNLINKSCSFYDIVNSDPRGKKYFERGFKIPINSYFNVDKKHYKFLIYGHDKIALLNKIISFSDVINNGGKVYFDNGTYIDIKYLISVITRTNIYCSRCSINHYFNNHKHYSCYLENGEFMEYNFIVINIDGLTPEYKLIYQKMFVKI